MRRIIAMFTVAVAGFAVVPQVAVGHHPTGQRGQQRHPGRRRELCPGDQRRRALRGLRLRRVEPFPAAETSPWRCSCAICGRDHRAGQRGQRRRGGHATPLIPAISAAGATWPSIGRVAPGPRRHERLWDVFVRDLRLGTTRRVSVAPGGTQANSCDSDRLAISADGRYVAFASDASNLVPGDTNLHADVFVRDRRLGTTRRVSVATGGTQAKGDIFFLATSVDGRHVAFGSDASNLVPGDTNGLSDVLVRDLRLGTTRRVSVAPGGTQANGDSD